tara:strand:- start:5229 stop:5987 length:759 start_codon:yes stop_codon:yes gene_type:complete
MVENWKEFSGSIAEAPPDTRIYAIGDIHGRLDLLEEMHGYIREDAASAEGRHIVIIYLGDYIDRGPASSQVVEYLIEEPLQCGSHHTEIKYVKGNHEDSLLRFVGGEQNGEAWFANGGLETFKSYGVELPGPAWQQDMNAVQKNFASKLPKTHMKFYQNLHNYFESGDYLFVHAGIRPNIALADQNPMDLNWIREPFLSSELNHGKFVVHGHSINNDPDIQSNRMGIDTGAYRTGCLTCAIFESKHVRFLQT